MIGIVEDMTSHIMIDHIMINLTTIDHIATNLTTTDQIVTNLINQSIQIQSHIEEQIAGLGEINIVIEIDIIKIVIITDTEGLETPVTKIDTKIHMIEMKVPVIEAGIKYQLRKIEIKRLVADIAIVKNIIIEKTRKKIRGLALTETTIKMKM